MHTILSLSSLLVVLVGGYVALRASDRSRDWTRRRYVQLSVLAAPVLGLGVALGGVHHFTGQTCFIAAPSWDYTLGVGLPLAMALVALVALGLGIVRATILQRAVGRRRVMTKPELQATADRLAGRLGAPGPRLRLLASDRPLALATGPWRPTLVLSTWMLDQLDARELEAVLAHELAHTAQRDPLIVWLATMLRDAFFYLPTSWTAHRRLQRDKELASDDLAVRATGRPLALAGALTKVWQQALEPPPAGVHALGGRGDAIEERIERLLHVRARHVPGPGAESSYRTATLGMGLAAFLGLLALEGASLAALLEPMGCGPTSVLGTSLLF